MTSRLVISTTARGDLRAIVVRISGDNPTRAVSFVAELWGRCREIAERPEAYAVVPRHAALGIRRAVHGNYLVFYRIDQSAVTILRVLHGSMDYSQLFGR
jgi:toxin ParE1/3/4